jgi:hypothetical protein
MDDKLQFPELTNTWTMPVQNRLDMALTGIKPPVGMKLRGTNLQQIQQLGAQVQQILSGLPQVRGETAFLALICSPWSTASRWASTECNGSSSLNAEVNAFERLQIVRGRNSSYFGSK